MSQKWGIGMSTEKNLYPRWGQPLTGIFAFIIFLLIAWSLWFIFSDPRGPVGAFPYPFVMYLAMMILVGLWQHLLFEDWPFQKLKQPLRGIVEVLVNLIIVWFVLHVVFDQLLGLGFNFLSQTRLNTLAENGQASMVDGQLMSLEIMRGRHYAQSAIVAFVLIGFFTYPFVTILFGKWPIRPSNLTQPQAGLAEFGWCTTLTIFFYTILIVPFWGAAFNTVFGPSLLLNTPWWMSVAGTSHLHWVFGFWEWMIIVLFMTVNVWRGKPWSVIILPQPWKGLISFAIIVVIGYTIALLCVNLSPLWLPEQTVAELTHNKDLTRFLWYHAAEIAGFTLIPFLIWHHYFDDFSPVGSKDSWTAFAFRTFGVLVFMILNYCLYYYANFGYWALGNSHMTELQHAFPAGESRVWNFWWIIPLLWNEWFFHKWPFYIHEH